MSTSDGPLGVVKRLDPGRWLARLRQPTRSPTDVLNVIDYADFDSYRWYTLMVYPTVLAVGGRAVWGGHWRRSVIGARWSKSLTVMRYPSHRIWMLMTSSPYYAVINGLRDRGAARFEASFTDPFVRGDRLRSATWALGAHFDAADPPAAVGRVRDVLASHGARLEYASVAYGDIDYLRGKKPNDPNPLAHRVTALLSVAGPEAGDPVAADRDVAALAATLDGFSLQLYQRAELRDYLPFTGRPGHPAP